MLLYLATSNSWHVHLQGTFANAADGEHARRQDFHHRGKLIIRLQATCLYARQLQMIVTVRLTCAAWDMYFQVDADTDTSTLRAIIEAETGLPVAQQAVYHNGKLLPSR